MIFSDGTAIDCEYVGHMKKWVEDTIEKLSKITIPSVADADTIRELVYFAGRTGPKLKANSNNAIAPVEKCSSFLKRYGCTCSEEYNCKKNDYSMYEANMSSK